jgi:hypothetical protein
MKLYEIPVNTLVELQFFYIDEKYKISSGLLYRIADTVYVSAVKTAGKTISAKRLLNFTLIYKADGSIYSFTGLNPRSISYNGQNLYAIQTNQDGKLISQRNATRLFLGAPVSAKITSEGAPRHLHCILKDISMTGMCIVSLSPIDETSKIEISFRANESAAETLIASITSTREFRSGNGFLYGCEFEAPNQIIGKYIEKRHAQLKELAERERAESKSAN